MDKEETSNLYIAMCIDKEISNTKKLKELLEKKGMSIGGVRNVDNLSEDAANEYYKGIIAVDEGRTIPFHFNDLPSFKLIEKPTPVTIFYMRDNFGFKEIPLDKEKALKILEEEFATGWTFGMLNSDAIKKTNKINYVHAFGLEHKEKFMAEAMEYIDIGIAIEKEQNKKYNEMMENRVSQRTHVICDEPDNDFIDHISKLGHLPKLTTEVTPIEEELKRLQNIIKKLEKYFTSNNSVPVERATILASDFWSIINSK